MFKIGDIVNITAIGYCGDEGLIYRIDRTLSETVFYVKTYRYGDHFKSFMEFGFKDKEVRYAGGSIIGGKYWRKADCKKSDIFKIGQAELSEYKDFHCMNNEKPSRDD